MNTKSPDKEQMKNLIKECKNSYDSIKLTSLPEESKKRIIKVLAQERKERFSQFDYLQILDSVKEDERIPKLYDLTTDLATEIDLSSTDFEDPLFGKFFIEQLNDNIKKEYGKTYEKQMPKNMQDLKKSLIPFDVTDEKFYEYLIMGNPSVLNYNGQELHLGLYYKKLLEEERRISKKMKADIERESKELIEKDEKIIELNHRKEAYKTKLSNNPDILSLQQRIDELEAKRPIVIVASDKAAIRRSETIDEQIGEVKKKIEVLESPINNNIKNIDNMIQARKEKIIQECEDMYNEKYGYDDILQQLKYCEKEAFEKKYPYLKDLYQDEIIKRGITQ